MSVADILDFNGAEPQRPVSAVPPDFDIRLDRLKAELSTRAPELVRELFPAAVFKGHEARVGDVTGEPGESLAIELTGDRAGLWFDHATGEGGDLIDLWGKVVPSQSFAAVVQDLERWCGWSQAPRWTSGVAKVSKERQAAAQTAPRPAQGLGEPVATWSYLDAAGALLATVKRFDTGGVDPATGKPKKTFRPFLASGAPGMPEPRPLYRLPDLAAAERVILVEGEKCADALAATGIAATSQMGGASANPEKTDWSPLAGKHVVIWPDNDAPGAEMVAKVRPALERVAASVTVMTVPADKPAKWDAADAIAEGFDVATFVAAKPAPPKTFNLRAWTAAAYAGPAKPIEYLCQGTIPLGVPVLFASMGGLGKSYMALDLALEIGVRVVSGTAGRPILGGQVISHGTAVVLSAEDSQDSIHRRLEKIDPDRDRLRDPGKLIIVPLPDMGGPKPLIASDGKTYAMTQAFHDLKAELREIPDLRLVVIDPLQAFVMADVNADPAAGQFMWSALASICAETGATVIVAHHMRKEGAASIQNAQQAREAIRGSTALVDGARMTYALWRAGADDGRDMCARLDIDYDAERIAFGAVVKANDEASREVQTYVRQPSGLLVDASARAAEAKPKQATSMHALREILREIEEAFERAQAGRGEGYGGSYHSGERYAAKLIMRRTGCSLAQAKDLLGAWLANRIVESQVVNSTTKKTALRVVGSLG